MHAGALYSRLMDMNYEKFQMSQADRENQTNPVGAQLLPFINNLADLQYRLPIYFM